MAVALLERREQLEEFTRQSDPIDVVAIAGGSGSTIESLVQDYVDGLSPIRIGAVIYNNSKKGVVERIDRLNDAYGLGIRKEHVSTKYFGGRPGLPGEQTLDEADRMAEIIDEENPAFALAAGYMKRFRGAMLQRRLINTHPSTLPLTRGLMLEGACQLVVAEGVPMSAQTLHEVNAEYDAGRVIAVNEFPVAPTDDWEEVARKAQMVEKFNLPLDLTNYALSLQR